MKSKKLMLAFLLFICLGALSFNIPIVKAAAPARYEYYVTGDGIAAEVYGDLWEAQIFTIGATGLNTDFNVTHISLKVYRFDAAKDFIYSIRAVNAANKPTGADLCGGTANATAWSTSATWINFTFTSEYRLKANTKYAIVMRSPTSTFGGGFPMVRYDVSPSYYPGGNDLVSWNGGGDWTGASNDFVFEVWGYAGQYTFHGLFDESTGLLKSAGERAVNTTAYFSGGITSEMFTVNGTYLYNCSAIPLYFRYDLGSCFREYWLAPNQYNGTFYIFNETLTTYTISFMDLAGALNTYPYIEAKRYINGSLMTVEKRKVDVEKKIQLSMKQGQTYTLLIGNGENYVYGDLLFTSTTSITLTLKGIEFPQNIILAYQYNRIYAYRHSNMSSISVLYQDVQQRASNVSINILFENGSSVSGSYPYWQNNTYYFNHTYASAYNTTYIVRVVIYHSTYGKLNYNTILARAWTTQPWNLPIGNIPNFNMADLIPIIIIVACFLVFSQINVPTGCFIGTSMAIIQTWLGWINIPSGLLVAAVVFTILIGLAHARRGG